MTEQKKDIQLHLRIYNRISVHDIFGPIKIKSLAAEFGVSERVVKGCIEQLIDAGCKIGSSKKDPMGVFRAKHPAEIFLTAERMRKEGIRYLLRAKKLLTWDGSSPTIFEQMPDVDDIVRQTESPETFQLPTG